MSKKNREAFLTLDRSQRLELSNEQSCHLVGATDHERCMYAAGFRKGFMAGRRNRLSLDRAHDRAARRRTGDWAWAVGYEDGMKFIPRQRLTKGSSKSANASLSEVEERRKEIREGQSLNLDALTDRERRRLKRRGRA